jgi:hypothetical protein
MGAFYFLSKDMTLTEPNHIPTAEAISKTLRTFPVDVQRIYHRSFRSLDGLLYGVVRINHGKKLIVIGEKETLLKDPFIGKLYKHTPSLKICDLSIENTLVLMELFSFARPISILDYPATIGTGDRLGLATPGHIRAIRKFNVRPVLAQQSIRENSQTGRNFKEVIADAAWSVFQEDYREGYGADGDHLTSLNEVRLALDSGVSMITLDLSDSLNVKAFALSREAIEQRFEHEIDPEDAEVLLHLFLDKEFRFRGNHGDLIIRFSEEEVKRHVLLFHRAIDFSEEVYQMIHQRTGKKPLIGFEISIDELPLPTTPETHLFLIIALRYRGVRIDSLAPRFIGEFQKGIDYRGGATSFREQFYRHVLIGHHYGNYKLSIHSGSDKFSIFADIGEISHGKFHLKTAGTSWLEAIRLISLKDPSLYREVHQTALSSFEEASRHYRVTADLANIPFLNDLADSELSGLLNQEDTRQLLHITYGVLLKSNLRNRIFKTLLQYEEHYADLLDRHFENHLERLKIERRN